MSAVHKHDIVHYGTSSQDHHARSTLLGAHWLPPLNSSKHKNNRHGPKVEQLHTLSTSLSHNGL